MIGMALWWQGWTVGSGLGPSDSVFEPEEEGTQVAGIVCCFHGARIGEVFGLGDGSGFGFFDGLSEGGIGLDPVVEGASSYAGAVAGGSARGASGEAGEDGLLPGREGGCFHGCRGGFFVVWRGR